MKKIFESIKPSVLVWNSLFLAVVITSAFIKIEIFAIIIALMSLLAVGFLFDKNSSLGNHLWVWFTPTIWILLIVFGANYLLSVLYRNTILKFNKWFDGKIKNNKYE